MKKVMFFLLVLVIFASTVIGGEAMDLTTELQKTPLGIDTPNPRFSWKMKTEQGKRGQAQTAYRILVATDPAKLKDDKPDVWDSKVIESSESVLVEGPKNLQSKTRYYWTVQIWDEKNKAGRYTEPTWFETGMPVSKDWDNAQWIKGDLDVQRDDFSDYWQKGAVLGAQKQLPKDANVSRADLNRYHSRIERSLDQSKPATYFRKEFALKAKPVRARLYITGLGYYKPFLNGQRVPSAHLAPNLSHYPRRVFYNVYDVTAMLKKGANCIGAVVAQGRWNEKPSPHIIYPYGEDSRLLARLEVDMSDGSKTVVGTGPSWTAGTGGIWRTAFWIGEAYDANRQPQGWNKPGFAGNWKPALVTDSPTDKLVWDYDLPQSQTAKIPAVSRTEVSPGVWVYDFGQMVIGKARIRFDLPKDEMVHIRYSETVNKTLEGTGIQSMYFHWYDGKVDQTHPQFLLPKRRGGSQIRGPGPGKVRGRFFLLGYADAFKSVGRPMEWMAGFDYTGFRYVEISTIDHPPRLEDVVAVAIHSDIPKAGKLELSDQFLNKVRNACYNSVLMNIHSQTEDNPGAERAGGIGMTGTINFTHMAYGGDYQFTARKLLDDTRIINDDYDYPATVTFTTRQAIKRNIVTAADGYVFGSLAYDYFLYYGDKEAMRRFVPTMQRYFDWLFFKNFIWRKQPRFADHLDYTAAADLKFRARPTDELYAHACQAAIQCQSFLKTLKLLDEQELYSKYNAEYQKLLGQIRKRYYDKKKDRFLTSAPTRQGANLFAMDAGLVPESQFQELVDEIVADIRKNNNHHVTGMRNSPRILYYLSHYGYPEEALRLMSRKEYPSIGNMFETTGTSSVWEDWGTPDKPAKSSFAQAEGVSAMANWFYRDLVGIEPEVNAPAFKRFKLKPYVPAKLDKIYFQYDSPRGVIESKLEKMGRRIQWKVTVPPNCSAEVTFPFGTLDEITKSQKPVLEVKGVEKLVESDVGPTVLLSSGSYTFMMPLADPKVSPNP